MKPPNVLKKRSDNCHVPSRRNNCSISIVNENRNTIFVDCHKICGKVGFFNSLSLYVHKSKIVNGMKSARFSGTSVVRTIWFDVESNLYKPQIPTIFPTGFSHKERLRSVLNRSYCFLILIRSQCFCAFLHFSFQNTFSRTSNYSKTLLNR